jgi:hypothetical protein
VARADHTDILGMAAVVHSPTPIGTLLEAALGGSARDVVKPDGVPAKRVALANVHIASAIVSKLAAHDLGAVVLVGVENVVADGAPLVVVKYLEETLAYTRCITAVRNEAKSAVVRALLRNSVCLGSLKVRGVLLGQAVVAAFGHLTYLIHLLIQR